MSNNNLMDKLVESGDIRSYSLEFLDASDNVVEKPDEDGGDERLTITFMSGKKICIDTYCTGFGHNTGMLFE